MISSQAVLKRRDSNQWIYQKFTGQTRQKDSQLSSIFLQSLSISMSVDYRYAHHYYTHDVRYSRCTRSSGLEIRLKKCIPGIPGKSNSHIQPCLDANHNHLHYGLLVAQAIFFCVRFL